MSRLETLIEISERVRDSVDVSQVAERFLTLVRHGKSFKALCPFHNDHTIGSFIITDSKKIWKCFSCGEGGDVINLYAKLKGIKYSEASLDIALLYGVISSTEYDNLTNRAFSEKENAKVEKIFIAKDMKKFQNNIAEPKILNDIYSVFSKGKSLNGGERLTSEHYNHLINDRRLDDEEIKKGGYFTLPDRRIMKVFLEEIKNIGYNEDVLRTIPGFLFDKKKNAYTFSYYKGGGIGIPIYNAEGLIIGIQVRRDVVEKKQSRYIWFSSSFTDCYDDLEYGTSPGSPIDVVYPKSVFVKGEKTSPVIFITEGRFKAQIIAKKYNSVTISVQGVCAWSKVIDCIKSIRELHPNINFQYIYICYDGDTSCNLGVFAQAIKMGKAIKTQIPSFSISFVLWDDDYGKGIDDLIFNNEDFRKIKVDLPVLESLYNPYIEELESYLTPEIDKLSKLPKETIKTVYLQQILYKLVKIQANKEKLIS